MRSCVLILTMLSLTGLASADTVLPDPPECACFVNSVHVRVISTLPDGRKVVRASFYHGVAPLGAGCLRPSVTWSADGPGEVTFTGTQNPTKVVDASVRGLYTLHAATAEGAEGSVRTLLP